MRRKNLNTILGLTLVFRFMLFADNVAGQKKYVAVPSNTGVNILSLVKSTEPATLRLNYPKSVPPELAKDMRLFRLLENGSFVDITQKVDIVNHQLVGQTTTFGLFQIVYPGTGPFLFASDDMVNNFSELEFSSNDPSAYLTKINSSEVADLTAKAQNQSLSVVSRMYKLLPEVPLYTPPAILTMRYSSATLEETGVVEETLVIYGYNLPQDTFIKMFGPGQMVDQTIDYENKTIRAAITRSMPAFVILGSTQALPVATILVNDVAVSIDSLVISSVDTISFTAFAESGIREILFSLDGYPEQPFVAPFTLSPDTHWLYFRSRANNGYLESLQTVVITVLDSKSPSHSD